MNEKITIEEVDEASKENLEIEKLEQYYVSGPGTEVECGICKRTNMLDAEEAMEVVFGQGVNCKDCSALIVAINVSVAVEDNQGDAE